MKFFDSILDLVGSTPLVRLNNIVEPGMATVFAKMETLNPTGSVKDRMAVHMVTRAEEAGLLLPGGTFVESTSGNTGLGLAMAAAFKGYHCVFTIPDKMSQEKIDMLNNKQIPIYEPGLEELVIKNYSSGRLIFTTNLKSAVRNSDIIFICVGTPTSKNKKMQI